MNHLRVLSSTDRPAMCRVSHSGNSGPDLWVPSSQIASFRDFARYPDADKADDGFRGSSEYPSSVSCVAKVSILPQGTAAQVGHRLKRCFFTNSAGTACFGTYIVGTQIPFLEMREGST